jgi:hypothetical protein
VPPAASITEVRTSRGTHAIQQVDDGIRVFTGFISLGICRAAKGAHTAYRARVKEVEDVICHVVHI